MAKLVSKVYGEALFEVAVDHGNAIRLMNETAELQKILEDNPDFDKLMKHPGIPKQEKLSMVEKVFRGRVSDDLAEFLKIVVTKERYGKIILTETGAALAHQLQAGLRDLERRLPALGLDLDREETAAVAGAGLSPAGALSPKALHDRIRRDNGMCHALKKQSCGFCRRTASFLEHRTIKEI